jgi:hypothetical protein
MDYFIDHQKKTIHQRKFAGDRCEFTDTPVQFREFNSSLQYADDLVRNQNYTKCPHCKTAQSIQIT